MSVTTLNGSVVETSETEAGKDFLATFRKASKAGSISDDLLAGAAAVYGSPVEETKAVVDGAQQVADGREMIRLGESAIAAHKDNAAKWLTIAHLAREGGVGGIRFGKALGVNKMTLTRLLSAHDVLEASRANHTPMTLAEAITYGNQHNKAEVTALVVAYGEAEDGIDPRAENVTAIPTEPKVPTVESYVRALDKVAEMLSGLQSGEFAHPKAETLEALKRQGEAWDRVRKQHDALTRKVERAGRSTTRKSA